MRDNVGGHANHSLFWRILGPPGDARPNGALADALADRFGGEAAFREEFSYLTYRNRRPEYIEAWWNVVDRDAVGERFAKVGQPVGAGR